MIDNYNLIDNNPFGLSYVYLFRYLENFNFKLSWDILKVIRLNSRDVINIINIVNIIYRTII